ncbi:unnamed protein product [Caenorhabditis auriculariae]|uniref:Knottin scorpion toxin-like domain-containing protein n=1 Tax=Caenorhabditis auriculariae TaxID=2777116 RepID=A0A8S1HE51_9PELO|nr:unnamed protein product [Caenorhabditis auriculariae]
MTTCQITFPLQITHPSLGNACESKADDVVQGERRRVEEVSEEVPPSDQFVCMSATRLYAALLLLFAKLPFIRSSCTYLDHQACDELCKVDSFWYGHCAAWDGFDFRCKCFEYSAPLNGKICTSRQQRCTEKCRSQGSEGGFCYPQLDAEGKTSRTGCECFKQLPSFVRRRRRFANYRR